MTIATRSDALSVVRAVLSADFGCDQNTWQSEGITIVTGPPGPNGRRYNKPAEFFEVATLGAGMVVHCSPGNATLLGERLSAIDHLTLSTLGWLSDQLGRVGLEMSGPTPNYVCGRRELVTIAPPEGVELSIVQSDRIFALYEHSGFSNALGYGKNPATPDKLAAVATHAGKILGMAGASADAETMWQIGIDVVPDARLSGIGAALVSRLAREVFDAGQLPYYAHALTNVASAALATKVGFRQAWVEIHAREQAGL